MKRKFLSVGVLAVALTAAARHPGYNQLASSAREFQQHYQELKAGNLGPVERIVVSLVLSSRS